MRCNKCGYEIPDDSEFCQYCGSRIDVQIEQANMPISSEVEQEDTSIASADEITKGQRYFDSDFGYSPDNPIVTSSVQTIGSYLYALRTSNGEKFTWEHMSPQHGDMIDGYQLYINGNPYRTIFFNSHGKDTEYVPFGLIRDADAFTAAQQGMTLEEYHARLEEEAEKKRIDDEKKKKKKGVIAKVIASILIIIVLTGIGYCGIHFGFPYLKYSIAVHNMNNGNAEKAMKAFAELGDYKDSRSCVTEAHYLWAVSLYEQKEYASAKKEFDSIKLYKNSKEMLQKCNFELGKQYMAEENFKEAITLLKSVNTNEVDSLLAECYYNYMIDLVANKDWGPAFVNYNHAQKYDHEQKYDLKQYQYEIYTQYATWKIGLGGETNCEDAMNAVVSLIQEFGKTDALLELQGKVEDALLEAKYQSALSLFTPSGYTSAVDKLSDILGYKDSGEKRLEAMYLYVQENKGKYDSAIDSTSSIGLRLLKMKDKETFYGYAEELSKSNYKDSKSYYEELTAWKVTTIMNNDPDDPVTKMNSISKYDSMCVHVVLRGGPLEGSTKLKYVFIMPDGDSLSGSWDFTFEHGTMGSAWCYYEQPQYGSSGTCYVKIYEKSSGKLLAQDQIRVTN